MDFSKGVAAIHILIGSEQRAGIIDTMGNFILEPNDIYQINPFSEYGYATFQKEKDGLFGLVKSDGSIILKPKYRKIDGFVNGHARVFSENKKWGLIDVEGELVIPTMYAAIDTLSEGMIAVKLPEKGWHFVDNQNLIQIKGPFEKVQEFKNGITLVEREDKKYIINNKGDIVQLKLGKPIFFSDGTPNIKPS